MKSDEPIAINPINFFIEVLKKGEKFPNEISYFDYQTELNKEFTNIQLKIILDKMLNLKDKKFLLIDRISESNLIYFLESDLIKNFENVNIYFQNKLDISAYITKIHYNKSFLLVMENDFTLNFLNGNKELHIFLDNFQSFSSFAEIISKIIGTNYVQSLEFIFKDKEADLYYELLEHILLSEANRNCVTQLVLHNRLAEFNKEKLENFVNKILLNHNNLRILKLVGFELSANELNLPAEDQENENNNIDNRINNDNNLNLANRKAELDFDFDVESILAKNNKIKILSVAHDRKINIANEFEFLEKFYICKTKELANEMLSCRYLATVRNKLLPAAAFFHRINGYLRKYLLKFFPVKSFEIKNEFADKFLNYIDKDTTNMLPDYVIAKIEKIGFERSNIKKLNMDHFLNEVL